MMDLTKAARVVRLAQRFADAINALDLEPAPRRKRRKKPEETKAAPKKAPPKKPATPREDEDDDI